MSLLAGKTGLIVGIANERSYAWYIAQSLMQHGATCAFTHLPGDRNAHRTSRAIKELGVENPWLKPMDASKDEEIGATFEQYGRDFGKLDFLIHSIAFADRDLLQPGKFITTGRQQYLSAIDISSYTLLAMARAAHPLMAKSGGGSILAMSYYGAEKVVSGYNVMGVAKAALECTGRYLANELGQDKIRVNIISGGYLRTLASSAVGGTSKMEEEVPKRAPLRRNVEGEDVGKTAAFLVSDMSSGMTGEVLYVDCGVNILGA
ncbi:MAG TPA: enoyl-ACP reductase [Phycisphaerales bacterium]|nr:enoyl-ACP reductase [Phycisphaerales bacterium]